MLLLSCATCCHLALKTLVDDVGQMPLRHTGRLLLLQHVLWLLLSHQVDVPLVDCGRGGRGGRLDLLERPGRCAVLVQRWRLAGRHRLKKQGGLLRLLHHLLRLCRWLRRQDARLRPSLLQDLLRSAQSLAHVEVGVPESLSRWRKIKMLSSRRTVVREIKEGSCSAPGRKLVSSWDPTGAGLSSDGWPRDWRLESASSSD